MVLLVINVKLSMPRLLTSTGITSIFV